MEAVKGVVKNIQISPIIVCGTCKGSGAKPGFKAENCKACGGSGNQYFTQGAFHLVATCQVCGGKGKTVPPSGRCSTCSGEKRVRERRNVTVEIPAGIEDDSEIRIKDKGNQPLEGGIPGDLFVHVKVSLVRVQGLNRRRCNLLQRLNDKERMFTLMQMFRFGWQRWADKSRFQRWMVMSS